MGTDGIGCEVSCTEGVCGGRGTCKMLALAGQSNGTNVGGRMRYARRGTMRPLARTNNV